jgi:hypothetical protein
MPLTHSKSKKAFSKNVSAEMHAGKPQDQALAIAYNVKRKAKKASGGTVESGSRDMNMAEGGDDFVSTEENEQRWKKTYKEALERHKAAGKPQHEAAKEAMNEAHEKHGVFGARMSKAEGGDIKGVHKEAGAYGNPYGAPTSKKSAKREHKEIMSSMPKPKLQGLAEGGEVSISAKTEKRPMPNDVHGDSDQTRRNSNRKGLGPSDWTDNPTIRQAQNNSGRMVKPIAKPRMVPSNAFSTRLYDEEGNLQESASPGGYADQPASWHDEADAKRRGKGPTVEPEHSTKAQPYHEDVEHDDTMDQSEPEMRRAKGGIIEESDRTSHNVNSRTDMEPEDHDIQMRLRLDEHDLMDREEPSEDEGSMTAHSRNEDGPDRQGPDVPDMEDEHSTGRKPYAKGGSIQYRDAMANEDEEMELNPAHDKHSPDDSEDQPDSPRDTDYWDDDGQEDSITAAIMARRDRLHDEVDSGAHDMDAAARYAEGGAILEERPSRIKSHGSMDSDDSDQADLSRNADEDANEEDQASWNALMKENYSESEGLKELDQPMDSGQTSDDEEMDSHDEHDMVDSIRKKMTSRRQFKG